LEDIYFYLEFYTSSDHQATAGKSGYREGKYEKYQNKA